MHRLLLILPLLALLPACQTPDSNTDTCRPNCLTRACGPDGCGGTCGTCGCASTCKKGLCASRAAGTWSGSYLCRQGRTSLTLTITGAGEDLEAVFDFGAHATNPDVPDGRFRMSGELDCEGKLSLEPERWVQRPDGYVAVGLAGELEEDGELLRGRVVGAGCSGFEVQRE